MALVVRAATNASRHKAVVSTIAPSSSCSKRRLFNSSSGRSSSSSSREALVEDSCLAPHKEDFRALRLLCRCSSRVVKLGRWVVLGRWEVYVEAVVVVAARLYRPLGCCNSRCLCSNNSNREVASLAGLGLVLGPGPVVVGLLQLPVCRVGTGSIPSREGTASREGEAVGPLSLPISLEPCSQC